MNQPVATFEDWVRGDMLGCETPAHSRALREGGAAFLTKAFQAAGQLAQDNRVVRITELKDWIGGGTGAKAILSVEYEKPRTDLPENLFVKYSRNFDNAHLDRVRYLMEPEVRLALLSRAPGFPTAVPKCMFADYHIASGTGILITERIPFGQNGIIAPFPKCMDYKIPDHAAHYKAILKALARLAGAHKGGALPNSVAQSFPFDAEKALANDRIPFTTQQIRNRVSRLAEFAREYPQLMYDNLRGAEFYVRLAEEAPRFYAQEVAIKHHLFAQDDYIALIHWNANIDNAWFWKNAAGEWECGLLDWGRVGQMHLALSLWGALSGAEKHIWDNHLDDLLEAFVAEFRAYGGPAIEAAELKFLLYICTGFMGLAYLMDAPPIIRAQIPDLAGAKSYHDARFEANELARTQLHIMNTFLNVWQTQDLGALLDRYLQRLR